jgi:hypothetical protein
VAINLLCGFILKKLKLLIMMKISWTLLILIALTGNAFAQKTIQELATMPEKKFDKLMTEENYAGQVRTFAKAYEKQTGKDLPDPVPVPLKRVALLSFFTADYSEVDVKLARKSKHGGAIIENYINTAGGSLLVNDFYKLSINEIKQIFASNGMELLTPEEFLVTEEQKQIYENTEINISKFAAGVTGVTSVLLKRDNKGLVTADGYRLYSEPIVNNGMDMRAVRDLGKLANELDVDAFLTINTLTQLEKGVVGLKGINMSLHAPNPVPNDPEMKYGMGFYYEGILVGSIGFTLEKYMPFAKLPKKATSFEDVDLKGFTALMERMTNQLLDSKKQNFGQ